MHVRACTAAIYAYIDERAAIIFDNLRRTQSGLMSPGPECDIHTTGLLLTSEIPLGCRWQLIYDYTTVRVLLYF